MEGNTSLWITIVVLTGTLALFIAWHRLRTMRLKSALDDARSAAEAEIDALTSEKEEQQQQIHADYSKLIAKEQLARAEEARRLKSRYEAEKSKLQSASDSLRSRNSKIEEALKRKVEHELGSREFLLEQCRDLGLSGALLTNVRYVTRSKANKPFHQQIDHLLVAEGCVAVVESKNWAGLIFDGLQPGSVHCSWDSVFDGIHLDDDFAVHVKRSREFGSTSNLTMRVVSESFGGTPPRRQAINQARNLQKVLAAKPGLRPPEFIRPTVFYSHAEATVHAADGVAGRSKTVVPVLTMEGDTVREFLRRESRVHRGPIDVRGIVNTLAPQATDITGFGDYEKEWTPVLL